ncbi:MAG: thiolase family protein [Desulfobacteraceae bacterium]|nr:thiolase family protein [Desulfobacteraceae bacterium]MBU4001678.1 thiolase family protein [Pseudomonadota bacterium]MBU4054834.1 thiolase family protein [Pseudomonadota bacterium]
MQLQNVVIVDGCRSAFSRGGKGKLEATRVDEVAATVVKALMERNPKVKPSMVEDFGIGNAGNTADLIMLGGISRLAGLPAEVTNFHSNRQCGSSMETMQRIAMAIMVGAMDCGIACGVERMGRSLMGERSGAKSTRVTGMNMRIFQKSRLQRDMAEDHFNYFSVPVPDAILDGPPMAAMTQTAQNVIDMYGLTRTELDQFAVDSHRKLDEAYKKGAYKAEIIPMEVEDPIFDDQGMWVEDQKGPMVMFDQDECLRVSTNLEGLAKLKPIGGVVSLLGNEVHVTAGNSCPTNSGASAILLMSEKTALKLGLEPLARIIGMGVGGVKGQLMGIGPIPASIKALKHAGLTADQIDRVEFNEAFAAQVIPSVKDIGLNPAVVNVNGGSLGIGHPLGATGARLVLTVAHELRRSGKKYGLSTQCIGAGQGITTIIESLG